MSSIRLFVVGDVMLARGIDMIQKFSCCPKLYEGNGLDAHAYVKLAVDVNGPLPTQRSPSYIWGDALRILDEKKPDIKIINLETSITTSDKPWPRKGIHYKMHPKNIEVIQSAGVDCCILSNNHTADWGFEGLRESIKTLKDAGMSFAGAGNNLSEAQAPSVFSIPGKGRVLVFGVGHHSSGVPSDWEATTSREGLCVLSIDNPSKAVKDLKVMINKFKKSGDIIVLSIHWGGNWGYEIHENERKFAHSAIREAGVDVIHGHSSHHPKCVEVYKGKLIMYGCGDFINDYEGISGHEYYRGDLALMFFVDVDARSGDLRGLTMVPTQTKRLCVNAASDKDIQWMANTMQRECKKMGCDVKRHANELRLTI